MLLSLFPRIKQRRCWKGDQLLKGRNMDSGLEIPFLFQETGKIPFKIFFVNDSANMQTGTDFMKPVHKLIKKICNFIHLKTTTLSLLYLWELFTVKRSRNVSAITVCKLLKSKSKNQGDVRFLHSFCMLFSVPWIHISLPSGNFCADTKQPQRFLRSQAETFPRLYKLNQVQWLLSH